jgi:hypothetical protein
MDRSSSPLPLPNFYAFLNTLDMHDALKRRQEQGTTVNSYENSLFTKYTCPYSSSEYDAQISRSSEKYSTLCLILF